MGYDQPKSLGGNETGGGLALPIWINYMQKALKDAPMVVRAVPSGVIESGGEYYYAEYPPSGSVRDLGMGEQSSVAAPEEDRSKGQNQNQNQMKNELF